jgi:predicted Fe-Mo cluster-binding NifX family protein
VTHVFGTGGGERMAREMGVPVLGRVPIDPQIVEACDAGTPYLQACAGSPTAEALAAIVEPLLALAAPAEAQQSVAQDPKAATDSDKETRTMRIAIPLAEGKLATHFGHCQAFALVDVVPATGVVARTVTAEPPPHAPGVLPAWLAEQGAEIIIAGGMGRRAQDLFARQGIQTVVGAPSAAPEDLVAAYVAGTLQPGENLCDH